MENGSDVTVSPDTEDNQDVLISQLSPAADTVLGVVMTTMGKSLIYLPYTRRPPPLH